MQSLLNDPLSKKVKRAIAIASLLLFLPGLPLALGFFCMILIVVIEGGSEALSIGLGGFTLIAIMLGAGGITLWHSLQSLQGKTSRSLNLPPVGAMAGVFGLCVVLGLFITESNFAAGLLFPPLLLLGAAVPPLLAVSWFTAQKAGRLTWRRGVVAFAGGATIGVAVALILEIMLPLIVLSVVLNLAEIATARLEDLFTALAGENIAAAITEPGFIFLLIQLAIIAPLAEEIAKPLITLPLIGHLSRRDTFLIGAMAGAGFAALENVLYAGFGFYFWAGILVVRALGGAIHPLGSGLVALGWRSVLRNEPGAWLNWLTRFGLAVGIHALWNGGSLLIITLAGAQFFGQLPPEINILGLSMAGTTMALLIILGLAALWVGRSIVQKVELAASDNCESAKPGFILSDRNVAIWGMVCLVAIVPVGITGLQLLFR